MVYESEKEAQDIIQKYEDDKFGVELVEKRVTAASLCQKIGSINYS